MSDFWEVIDEQLAELRSASTADDVIRILANERDPYGLGGGGSDAFFAGGGGDVSVQSSLHDAGWRLVQADAYYYYVMRAPNGDEVTYCEGDIYRGNRMQVQS